MSAEFAYIPNTPDELDTYRLAGAKLEILHTQDKRSDRYAILDGQEYLLTSYEYTSSPKERRAFLQLEREQVDYQKPRAIDLPRRIGRSAMRPFTNRFDQIISGEMNVSPSDRRDIPAVNLQYIRRGSLLVPTELSRIEPFEIPSMVEVLRIIAEVDPNRPVYMEADFGSDEIDRLSRYQEPFKAFLRDIIASEGREPITAQQPTSHSDIGIFSDSSMDQLDEQSEHPTLEAWYRFVDTDEYIHVEQWISDSGEERYRFCYAYSDFMSKEHSFTYTSDEDSGIFRMESWYSDSEELPNDFNHFSGKHTMNELQVAHFFDLLGRRHEAIKLED